MLGSQQLSAKDGTQHQVSCLHPNTQQEATGMLRFCKISFTKNWGGVGVGSGEGYCLKDVWKPESVWPQSKKTRSSDLNLRTEVRHNLCGEKNQCSVSGSNCYLSESCHTRYKAKWPLKYMPRTTNCDETVHNVIWSIHPLAKCVKILLMNPLYSLGRCSTWNQKFFKDHSKKKKRRWGDGRVGKMEKKREKREGEKEK